MALGLCLRKASFAACLPDVYTPENLNAPQTSTLWKGKTPSKSFLGCIYSESCKFDFDSFSPLVFFRYTFGTQPILIGLMVLSSFVWNLR